MSISPTVIRVNDVSKRFVIRKDKSLKERVVNFRRSQRHKEDFWALTDVNLEITSGEFVGLVGHNGSGKSTLLKTIGGIIEPTQGVVERRGRLAALIEIGAGFHPDLTGRENVYLNSSILGLTRKETDKAFDSIVAFSGIEQFIDTQVKFYSSGMYVRLAFAVAVHIDPDVLLVDEVLAVGDEPFQRKCVDRIRRFQTEGRTIVLVSHALDQVGELCDRVVALEHGSVVIDDQPRRALHVLRTEYEAARLDEVNAGVPVEQTAAATVEAVRPVTASGALAETLVPGDDLILEVDVRAHEAHDDWMVGIGIDTPLGQVVYGTNTEILDVQLPPIAAGELRTVRIELSDLRLGAGEYYVHGSVAGKTKEELHRIRQAAMFGVESKRDGKGVIDVRARLLP